MRVAQYADDMIKDLAGRVHAGNAQIVGKIKLSLLAPFAGLLMGAIERIRSNNTHCVVRVDGSDDLARLGYDKAHIAQCTGAKPEHPDSVVSQFGDIGLSLYVHDSYLVRYG